jgi:hypothetical protein
MASDINVSALFSITVTENHLITCLVSLEKEIKICTDLLQENSRLIIRRIEVGVSAVSAVSDSKLLVVKFKRENPAKNISEVYRIVINWKF